ncbi:MAG: radical SAM protein [Candidatus Helarchaeota archaeon]
MINHFSSPNKLPIRLYPTTYCNFNCRTPFGTIYCDHKRGNGYNVNYEDFLTIAKLFKKSGLSEIAKISGLEPTRYPYLIELIDGLKREFNKITLSTNGSASIEYYLKIIDHGVTHLTFTLNSLNPLKYAYHIGVELNYGIKLFNDLIKKIKILAEQNIEIHLNRIIMKNFNDSNDEFNRFLQFSRELNIKAKIFEFNFHPMLNIISPNHNSKFDKNELNVTAAEIYSKLFIDLERYYNRLLINKIYKEEYRNLYSRRILYYIVLNDGTKILFDKFNGNIKSYPQCSKCKYNLVCKEGLYSNGWELYPDLAIYPCVIRKDLKIPMGKFEQYTKVKFENGRLIFE